MGSCCKGWGDRSSECLELEVLRFGATREEMRDALRTIQQSDPSFASHELLVSVELIGPKGPRCAPGKCGPLPYESFGNELTPPSTATARRFPTGPPSKQGPACQHDGECTLDGCSCAHWTVAGVTCAGGGWLGMETSLCGCFESRCTLFFEETD
jgi:hypothetical protein